MKHKLANNSFTKWVMGLSKPIKVLILCIIAGTLLVGGGVFAQNYYSNTTKTNPTDKTEPTKSSENTVPKNFNTNNTDNSQSPVKQNSTSTSNGGTSCTTTVISYGVNYEKVEWLYIDQSELSVKGTQGSKQICVDASGKTSEKIIKAAVNEVWRVGTKSRTTQTQPSPPQTPQYTYEQALSLATQTCLSKGYAPDSTDMTYCKNTEMKKYGY